MQSGGGKAKGNAFEIEVGQWLSWWITEPLGPKDQKSELRQRNDIFCRSVLSGGQFTVMSKREKLVGNAGDLQPNHELAFPFCRKFVIECKTWEYLYILDFLMKKGDLYSALNKVMEEAHLNKKFWLLIARQTRKPMLALFAMPPDPSVLALSSWHSLFNGTVCMVNFLELMETVTADVFIRMYNDIDDEMEEAG
jgi:hypothetical protein